MTTSTNTNTPIITIKNNQTVTSSRHLAEYFGKRHDHVLRAIDGLIETVPACAPIFGATTTITQMPAGGVRKDRSFDMTRDAFTLLAMGFTGKKAIGFKLKYIQQFNVMEELLKAPVKEQPKAEVMVYLEVVVRL